MQTNNPEWPVSQSDATAQVGDLTRIVLRRALADLRSGCRPDGNIAEGLRDVCDAAREQGLHAEELLVILKQSWWRLPDAQSLNHRDVAATLEQVVTMCIEEFYRSGPRH